MFPHDNVVMLFLAGAREASFRNIKSISECLADELINAAKVYIYFLLGSSSVAWPPCHI